MEKEYGKPYKRGNKMEENKTDYITEGKVKILGIELKMFPNSDDIYKVLFETDKGNLTWKPKMDRTTMENGCKIKSQSAMKKTEFFALKKTNELLKHIKINGVVDVVMDYGTLTADKDGEEVTYRFIRFLSQYDNIKVVGETEIKA